MSDKRSLEELLEQLSPLHEPGICLLAMRAAARVIRELRQTMGDSVMAAHGVLSPQSGSIPITPTCLYSGQTNDESPEAAMLPDGYDGPEFGDGPEFAGWADRAALAEVKP